MPQRIENAVGRAVRGANFFARDREQRRVWRRLATDNLLLLAPRRVGKTSLLFKVEDTAEANGFVAVYASVADARDEVDFIRRLVEAAGSLDETQDLFKKLSAGPLGKLFKRTRGLGVASLSWTLAPDTSAEEWAELGRLLTDGLSQWVPGDRRFLFLVDEVPLFVDTLLGESADPDVERARHFLNWFRRLRQGGEDTNFVRWVAAGSIGLDTITALHGMGDTINDFNLMPLGAFAPDEADAFLVALGESHRLELDPATRARILERVGWPIPFFLQLLFARLLDVCKDEEVPASAAAVDGVYEELLSPGNRAHFDYWRQRLYKELRRPRADQAVALLNVCCHDSAGPTRATLRSTLGKLIEDPQARDDRLRFLLDVLLTDGYLTEDGDRYPFRSTLLRDFWKRRVAPT